MARIFLSVAMSSSILSACLSPARGAEEEQLRGYSQSNKLRIILDQAIALFKDSNSSLLN